MDLLLPSLAALAGGGVAAAHYLRHRLTSHEDRFMASYGLDGWEDSNMILSLRFDPAHEDTVKQGLRDRLRALLDARDPRIQLLRERAEPSPAAIAFVDDVGVDVDALYRHRRGVWFDDGQPGRVRVTWSHMQTDGVGIWSALRPVFDANPPLVTYADVRPPPPFLPELLSAPRLIRRLGVKGSLASAMLDEVHHGFQVWDAAAVRALRDATGGRFNLLTTALVARAVFARHPEVDRLQLGVTLYFPFLQARNRYGVLTVVVARGSLAAIAETLARQLRSPMLAWGTNSATSAVLRLLPDAAFLDVVGHFRRQIDVLVSNLPVATEPIALAGAPVQIGCHCDVLTVPYYFLLIGTRHELHVSWTARFEHEASFASLAQASAGG